MLNVSGAKPILQDIPISFLDPLHLARSQNRNVTGFIAVVYSAYADIFFIKRSAIFDVGRITADFRFRLNLDTALDCAQTAKSTDLQAVVSLSYMNDQDLTTFRKTFYLEPCLKLHTHVLDISGIQSLDEITTCSKGIMEINTFLPNSASIRFHVLDNNHTELLNEIMILERSRASRLLFYDEEKNTQIFPAKFLSRYEELDAPLSRFTHLDKLLQENLNQANAVKPLNSIPGLLSKTSAAVEQRIVEPFPVDTSPDDAVYTEFEMVMEKLSKGEALSDSNCIALDRPPTSSSNDAPITIHTHALDIFKEFYDQYRVELKKHSKKCDIIIEDALHEVHEQYPLGSITITENVLNVHTEALLGVLELCHASISHFNPITGMRARKALKEKLIILITGLYNDHYELLDHFNLLDGISEIYSTLKS
ncbi:hypothetical protein JNM05_09660 [bacterium]|nr:hypothetical protein [bacterium]